jgi:hypothetical protein
MGITVDELLEKTKEEDSKGEGKNSGDMDGVKKLTLEEMSEKYPFDLKFSINIVKTN